MITTEIRNYARNVEKLIFNDEVPATIEHVPSLFCDTEPAIVKSQSNHLVFKSYEMTGKALAESYFDTDYSEEDIELVNDFADNHKNGIILIMNEKMSTEEVYYLSENLKGKLKSIIFFNGDAGHFDTRYLHGVTFVKTFSLKAAVAFAYSNIKKGQAIVFPKVDENFDFFSMIDSLN